MLIQSSAVDYDVAGSEAERTVSSSNEREDDQYVLFKKYMYYIINVVKV